MKILVTGATGYIGSRLIPSLVQNGHEVIALVRSIERAYFPEGTKIISGDLLDPETFERLPKDIDAAYYLVHSMSREGSAFAEKEKQVAENFVEYINKTQAKQIIYLSGIVNAKKLSKHLQSRLTVEKTLRTSTVPLTTLRAAIIIGSGSASFEIIRDLVEKLPIMVTPRWVQSRCQPIAVADVIDYLTQILVKEEALGRSFDIGGPNILSYREMLLGLAKFRKLVRFIIPVPVLSPQLSSYWLFFITSTNFALARALVDSLRNDAICENHDIDKVVPKSCMSYQEAIKRAFSKIEQNAVVSSWMDSWSTSTLNPDLLKYLNKPEYGCLSESSRKEFSFPPEKVMTTLLNLGKHHDWFYLNWAWRIRGALDRLFGGVGLRRGRVPHSKLRPGDPVSFWRAIVVDEKERRILLYAEMKLPGEAWLEFEILPKNEHHTLKQTATFRPRGLLGRLYWYSLFPIHKILFKGMVKKILKSSERN